MIDNTIPICYRLKTNDDLPFIYASWLSSIRSNTSAYLSPQALYTSEQTKKINHILSISNTFIAYLDPLPDETQTLLGYAAYQYLNDHLLIHFSFVKSPFRSFNILSNILDLINIPKLPIILTYPPDPKLLKQLNQNHNIIYDHFYYERSFYVK